MSFEVHKLQMVSDTLDAMLEESGDEAERDAVISQVLDEIGIDLNVQVRLNFQLLWFLKPRSR